MNLIEIKKCKKMRNRGERCKIAQNNKICVQVKLKLFKNCEQSQQGQMWKTKKQAKIVK